MYYTYTCFFRNDHNRVVWLSIVKIKPKSHIQVDANELNVILSICIFKEIDDDDESDLEFNKEDDVGHNNEERKKKGF